MATSATFDPVFPRPKRSRFSFSNFETLNSLPQPHAVAPDCTCGDSPIASSGPVDFLRTNVLQQALTTTSPNAPASHTGTFRSRLKTRRVHGSTSGSDRHYSG